MQGQYVTEASEKEHEMAKTQLVRDLVRLDFIWSLMSSH